MTEINHSNAPPLDGFDLSNLREPDDGILYLYRSFVDGFWHIDPDEDMALQEATGHPVGELIEYEEMGDYLDSEDGELHALYVGDPQTNEMTQDINEENWPYCPRCGDELEEPAGPYADWTDCPNCGRIWVECYIDQRPDYTYD